jgi:hypothetical protein
VFKCYTRKFIEVVVVSPELKEIREYIYSWEKLQKRYAIFFSTPPPYIHNTFLLYQKASSPTALVK